MDRILIVASDYPYPPHHGGAVDAWNLVLGLKRLGFSLDLIATVKKPPKQEHIDTVRAIVKNLWVVERNRDVFAALSLVPFQARSRRALENVDLNEPYKAVLLESEFVAPILKNPRLSAEIRILRVPNDEEGYLRALSKSTDGWGRRFFYRIEAMKFRSFSATVKSKCDLLWFISNLEMTRHLQLHPKDSPKSFFLPPDPGVREMRSYSEDGQGALFIGSLTNAFNLEGLEWYIRNVHGRLSSIRGYSLVVAGRTDSASRAKLNKMIQPHPNISLHIDPLDLTSFYERAAVFINPMQRGAGVKIKTIHALHAGLPVVSTSTGIEGTGLTNGEHLLVADSADDFVRNVEALLSDRLLAGRLVRSGQSFLAETYDHERNISRSLSSVFPFRSESVSPDPLGSE